MKITKQIKSLADKYGINTETNTIFQSIIEMFDNKPNYQVWGVKSVFGRETTPDQLTFIGNWISENKNLIAQLSKGNIINYKTRNDFSLLMSEIEKLNKLSLMRKVINTFDTEQKKILTQSIGLNEIKSTDPDNRKFEECYVTLRQFSKLQKPRRDKFIRLASALTDYRLIIDGIKNCLKNTYIWNKEDFLSFISINTRCEVVYDKDNIVIVRVPDFETSKLLCGGGRTVWCITREGSYFSNYVTKGRSQYFLFNFGKPETDEIAHVGFTVDPQYGIVNAHSTNNKDMSGGGISYRGKQINISSLLGSYGIDISLFMKLKGTVKFNWNIEGLIEFLARRSSVKVKYNDKNIVIVEVTSESPFDGLVGHTFIPYSVNSRLSQYIVFNFNEKVDTQKSIVSLYYNLDRFGSKSLSRVVDAFGKEIETKTFYSSIGVSESAVIDFNNIEPSLLLHKYIEESNEAAAIELIRTHYHSIDVNKVFEERLPIYAAINNKMPKLFHEIFSHEKFNSNSVDGFENNILGSLIYLLRTPEFISSKQDEDAINEIINYVIDSNKFDLNMVDCLGDTALMISCENVKSLQVTKKLASKANVNPNVVNNFGENALIKCIDFRNEEALKVIASMPGIEITSEVYDKAKSAGYDLKTIITNAYAVVGA